MKNGQKILQNFAGQKILVAGDLMQDRFVYGEVNRISPESPVPVLSITHEDVMLGGAGNVISSLHALGCVPVPFAVVGDDEAGKKLCAMLSSHKLDIAGVMVDNSRPTTIKTRYVAQRQQLLRSDFEKTHALSAALQKEVLAKVAQVMPAMRAVVLSDYGKGFLTKDLIEGIIALAHKHNIPVLVDPKGDDYTRYRGADVVTPNRKELAQASGYDHVKTDDEIICSAQKIIKDCGIACVVATRSEDGLSVISKAGDVVHIPTKAQEVFDVSGAGDAVIATLAACLATGADTKDAAIMANYAGGIVVSKSGTTPVRRAELESALGDDAMPSSPHSAMITGSFDEAAEQVRTWQAMGLKVGLTNGCFDIVHAGHVNYINQARGKCDRLVLALNHDDSVKILKGPTRPVNDENARAVVIGGLGAVDMVVFFGARKAGDDNTPCALIERAKPDIYFKGGDYTIDQLPEAKIVMGYGGEVAIMAMHEGFSTTSIIQKTSKAG